MFTRPFLIQNAAPQYRPRSVPHWLRVTDWLMTLTMIAGLWFCWGGPLAALRHYYATHATIELDPPTPLSPPTLQLTAYDREQIQCLATNVWQEAANQGPDGMRAVADVTINRLFSGHFGGDVCAVVTAHWRVATRSPDPAHLLVYRTHWEFSWLASPHPALPRGDSWRTAQRVAAAVYLQGDRERDLTHGARYYLNPQLTRTRRSPDAISAVIGAHVFYTR